LGSNFNWSNRRLQQAGITHHTSSRTVDKPEHAAFARSLCHCQFGQRQLWLAPVVLGLYPSCLIVCAHVVASANDQIAFPFARPQAVRLSAASPSCTGIERNEALQRRQDDFAHYSVTTDFSSAPIVHFMRDHRTPSLRGPLATKLRMLRERRELTQEKLAFLAGLHRNYVSLLERGVKSPTIDVLQRLAHALGVKTSTLLARAEASCRPSKSND
jgi:DNA-binding XRE family transcriptional regulator